MTDTLDLNTFGIQRGTAFSGSGTFLVRGNTAFRQYPTEASHLRADQATHYVQTLPGLCPACGAELRRYGKRNASGYLYKCTNRGVCKQRFTSKHDRFLTSILGRNGRKAAEQRARRDVDEPIPRGSAIAGDIPAHKRMNVGNWKVSPHLGGYDVGAADTSVISVRRSLRDVTVLGGTPQLMASMFEEATELARRQDPDAVIVSYHTDQDMAAGYLRADFTVQRRVRRTIPTQPWDYGISPL